MICLEWWAWEAMTLLVAYVGVDELAAQTISMDLYSTFFMIALGL